MAVPEKRDYYEVLGLSRDCSPDEIRSAYKKLALQRHPDKLVQSGISGEAATAQFQELVHAYEVLSDPKERSWYDNHRSQVLFSDARSSSATSPILDLSPFLSNSAFSGYSDTGKGFYKVYSDVFGRVYAAELNYARKMGLGLDAVREAPLMGNLNSPYAQVTAFYNYWLGFGTVMDFGWVDMYDAAAGESRRSRRMMEEENKKLRKKARREYNEMVRGLGEFAKKRDKRVIDMAVKRNMEIEKKRQEMEKKRQQEKLEKMRAYKEPEWAAADEDEDLEYKDDDFGDGEDKKEEELYCVVCGKKFKSKKQWENHEKSKKHKEKVTALRESFMEEDEALNEEEAEAEGRASEEDREFENGSKESLEEDGVEEIEKRVRDELEVEDESGSGEEERFFEASDGVNLEEEVEEKAGSSGGDGEDRGRDEIGVEEDVREDAVGSSGGVREDQGVDDISILEAMLSGRKNRRKAAASMQEDHKSGAGDTEFMEYDNRKSSRRKGKKEKAKKNNGEASGHQRDEDGSDAPNQEASVPKSEAKSAGDDEIVEKRKKDKASMKKDTNTKSKNLPKGKKGKASAKNAENLCDTCGQEFESRNKLHKHLGETGHASLKFRR